jgi:hypothetical protein
MAVVVSDRFPFMEGDETSRTLHYFATGDEDEGAVIAAVWTAAPATTTDGLKKRSVSSIEQKGLHPSALWYVDVQYGPLQSIQYAPPETGEFEFSFDIGTESQKIMFAKSTVAIYPRNVGDNFTALVGNKININSEGKVEGVDILFPTARRVISYFPANGVVTETYQKTLEDLVPSVNNATFKGRAAGELLLLGVSGRSRNNDDWQISFTFGVRKNETGLTIDGITGIAKDGWDYLWPLHEIHPDVDAKKIVERATAYVVSRPYERKNFADLGLP